MALLSSTSLTLLAFSENPKPFSCSSKFSIITFFPHSPLKLPSFRFKSSASGGTPGPVPGETSGGDDADKSSKYSANTTDEWGEEYEPEPEASITKLPDSDPPKDEDEWEEREYIDKGNGIPATPIKDKEQEVDDRLEGLKRALVDTVYGTDFGFRASAEVRAEVSELVTQLEAANPTRAPVEEPGLLNGNWVLL